MRVYVLGAGASRHVGYPLANQLISQLKQWADTSPDASEYRPSIDAVYALSRQDLSIEQLLTNLDEGSVSLEGWPYVRSALQRALCLHFNELRRNVSPGYRAFARTQVEPGDVILTFNYDVSLERELKQADKWEVGGGYGFRIGDNLTPTSPTTLLKLHGSTNWMGLLFGGRTGVFHIGSDPSLGLRPIILPGEMEFLGYPNEVRDPLFNGGAAVNAFILPTLSKQFYFRTSLGDEWLPFWDDLWDQGARALELADEIIVLGYSFPAADERANALLGGVRRKDAKVTVCSMQDSDRIGRLLKECGYQDVTTIADQRFEQWATHCIQPVR